MRLTLLTLLCTLSLSTIAASSSSPKQFFIYDETTLSNETTRIEAVQFLEQHPKNTVVIVDDCAIQRKIMAFHLKEFGVFQFTNGRDFLDALYDNDFGPRLRHSAFLVILDNQMPEILGIDVMAIIVEENLLTMGEGYDRIPVAFNTSDDLSHFELSQLENFYKIIKPKSSPSEIRAAAKEAKAPNGELDY